MIAAAFFLGTLVGVAGTLLFAVWLAARPKTTDKPQHQPTAIGLDMNNKGGVSLDSYHAKLMTEVIKHLEGKA